MRSTCPHVGDTQGDAGFRGMGARHLGEEVRKVQCGCADTVVRANVCAESCAHPDTPTTQTGTAPMSMSTARCHTETILISISTSRWDTSSMPPDRRCWCVWGGRMGGGGGLTWSGGDPDNHAQHAALDVLHPHANLTRHAFVRGCRCRMPATQSRRALSDSLSDS